MTSKPDWSEISPLFERLVRNRDESRFLPFIFGLSNDASRTESDDPVQENEYEESTRRERASSLGTLFRELGNGKSGQPPASKESIDAMLSVEMKEGDDGYCVFCLEEWEIGGVVKEMPCKHKFHPKCIEFWLGIHGSYPVCRYQMPMRS